MSSAVKTHRTYFAPTWPSFGFPLHAERSKQMIQSGAGRVNDKIHASEILGWETLSHRFITITERARTDEAFFIRHGATKYNERNLVSGQHNTSLSTKGKDEARRLRYFLPQKIDLIVCSELRRSIETMILSVPEELLQKIPVRSDFRLNEVHLGALQGKRRHHIGHFASGDLDFAPEGGESYRQAARRVLSAVVDMFDALALLWQIVRDGLSDDFVAVRTSPYRGPCKEVKDGLPDGRHGRLWGWPSDSFFSVPLL